MFGSLKYLPLIATLIVAPTMAAPVDPHAGQHPPQTGAPVTVPEQKAQNATSAPQTTAGSMMERMAKAKTPAERHALMVENMTMMKAQMAEMKAMMNMGDMMMGKQMPMPMPMDAEHMEKMHKHMAMMHQMMESLMMQQELLMPAK